MEKKIEFDNCTWDNECENNPSTCGFYSEERCKEIRHIETISTSTTTTATDKITEETIELDLFLSCSQHLINTALKDETKKAILLSQIIQTPELNKILQNYYIDLFGSNGEIIVDLTDETMDKIIGNIVDVCNENIVTSGYHNDIETYIDLDYDGRQYENLKRWVIKTITRKENE